MRHPSSSRSSTNYAELLQFTGSCVKHLLLEGIRFLHWDAQQSEPGTGMLQKASRKCLDLKFPLQTELSTCFNAIVKQDL